jgi:hypothetical protein
VSIYISFRNERAMSFNDLLDAAVGKDVRAQRRSNLVARNNTPSIKDHFVLAGERPLSFFDSDTLWIGELQ